MSGSAHRRDAGAGHSTGSHGHSTWLMLLCCIPMLIPLLLIIFGR